MLEELGKNVSVVGHEITPEAMVEWSCCVVMLS